MIPFWTTKAERVRIKHIATAMIEADVSFDLVSDACRLANDDEGVFDLMQLWYTSETRRERDEVIAELQESIKDYEE